MTRPDPQPPTSAFIEQARRTVDASIDHPSVARVYDYLLGGNNNFPVDREFAERQLAIFPDLKSGIRTNRAFLQRAVRNSVRHHDIYQFVDFGSGLPTVGNVHDVADSNRPGQCHVVYIDNEPIANAHATILLSETSDLSRHYPIFGDFYDSEATWERILASRYIDPTKPVGLLAVALLHFMPRDTHPERHLAYYLDQLPPGSILALSHACNEIDDDDFETVRANYDRETNNRTTFRTREEITALFDGLDLLEPGVVWAPQWRPDPKNDPYVMSGVPDHADDPARSLVLCGVAIKPK